MNRLLLLLLACSLALAGCQDDAESRPGLATDASVTPAAPPAAPTSISRFLPTERDPHKVVSQLSIAGLSEVVALAEAGDVAPIVARMPRETVACDERLVRGGGNVCDRLGLTPGTAVDWIIAPPGVELASAYEEQLRAGVAGREPVLELIARRDRSDYYLIFNLGGGAADLMVITLRPSDAAPVVEAHAGSYGGPPLEFIRFDTYGPSKAHTWEILAAADSFHQRELAWAQQMRRDSVAPPPDHVSP